MICRSLALVCACLLGLVAGGCGAGSSSSGTANPNDKQEVTRACLEKEGFDAQSVGEAIQIEGPNGPRVEFNISGGESETRTFKGEAQGAEQIGSTLLFVGPANDDELKKIETCVIE